MTETPRIKPEETREHPEVPSDLNESTPWGGSSDAHTIEAPHSRQDDTDGIVEIREEVDGAFSEDEPVSDTQPRQLNLLMSLNWEPTTHHKHHRINKAGRVIAGFTNRFGRKQHVGHPTLPVRNSEYIQHNDTDAALHNVEMGRRVAGVSWESFSGAFKVLEKSKTGEKGYVVEHENPYTGTSEEIVMNIVELKLRLREASNKNHLLMQALAKLTESDERNIDPSFFDSIEDLAGNTSSESLSEKLAGMGVLTEETFGRFGDVRRKNAALVVAEYDPAAGRVIRTEHGGPREVTLRTGIRTLNTLLANEYYTQTGSRGPNLSMNDGYGDYLSFAQFLVETGEPTAGFAWRSSKPGISTIYQITNSGDGVFKLRYSPSGTSGQFEDIDKTFSSEDIVRFLNGDEPVL